MLRDIIMAAREGRRVRQKAAMLVPLRGAPTRRLHRTLLRMTRE